MNIHQVNSKETMLNENDIVIVSAYMTDTPPKIKNAAKKNGLSTERLVYTIYLQQMQNPSLIRIREGNTLFTIAALPERYGYVSIYNGDTNNSISTNISNFTQSAYKIGFNILMLKGMDESLKDNIKAIQGAIQNAKVSYDKSNDLLYVKFNQPHGD